MKTKHLFFALVFSLIFPLTSFKSSLKPDLKRSETKATKKTKKQTDIYIGYANNSPGAGYYFIYGDLSTFDVSDIKYGTTTSEADAVPVYSFNAKISQTNGVGPYLVTGRVYFSAGSFVVLGYRPITTDL